MVARKKIKFNCAHCGGANACVDRSLSNDHLAILKSAVWEFLEAKDKQNKIRTLNNLIVVHDSITFFEENYEGSIK